MLQPTNRFQLGVFISKLELSLYNASVSRFLRSDVEGEASRLGYIRSTYFNA